MLPKHILTEPALLKSLVTLSNYTAGMGEGYGKYGFENHGTETAFRRRIVVWSTKFHLPNSRVSKQLLPIFPQQLLTHLWLEVIKRFEVF
jgi:hypothetical protein